MALQYTGVPLVSATQHGLQTRACPVVSNIAATCKERRQNYKNVAATVQGISAIASNFLKHQHSSLPWSSSPSLSVSISLYIWFFKIHLGFLSSGMSESKQQVGFPSVCISWNQGHSVTQPLLSYPNQEMDPAAIRGSHLQTGIPRVSLPSCSWCGIGSGLHVTFSCSVRVVSFIQSSNFSFRDLDTSAADFLGQVFCGCVWYFLWMGFGLCSLGWDTSETVMSFLVHLFRSTKWIFVEYFRPFLCPLVLQGFAGSLTYMKPVVARPHVS